MGEGGCPGRLCDLWRLRNPLSDPGHRQPQLEALLPCQVARSMRQRGVGAAGAHSAVARWAGLFREREGIIGQAYGRKIHAREVVAIDEAGDGLCWVRLRRFGDDWLLIRSDARDVSCAVRKLRQIPAGEQSERFPEFGP